MRVELHKNTKDVWSLYPTDELQGRMRHLNSVGTLVVYDIDGTLRDSPGIRMALRNFSHLSQLGSNAAFLGYTAGKVLQNRGLQGAQHESFQYWVDHVYAGLSREQRTALVSNSLPALYPGVTDFNEAFPCAARAIVSRNVDLVVDATASEIGIEHKEAEVWDKGRRICELAAEAGAKDILLFGDSPVDFSAAAYARRKGHNVELVVVAKKPTFVEEGTIFITRDYTGLTSLL